MSKMQIAIIDILSTGRCMTSNEIAEEAGLPKPYVRVTLATMTRDGLIIKNDSPDNNKTMLHKKTDKQSGFGVSRVMSEFDKCIREARQ